MQQLEALLSNIAGMIWTYPVVILCLGLSVFYSFRLKFVQFSGFKHAIKLIQGKYDDPNEEGQITHFQALSAALSGTIGIGNIAGVAIAISMGGPGAVFWMWVLGIMGMATKFAECTLGTYYRETNEKTGETYGGPMYYIEKGLGKKWKPLALTYGAVLAMGAFGFTCLFQSNQAAVALNNSFNIPDWVTGAAFFVIGYVVILGGITRIGQFASKVVPTMCGVYIAGAVLICVLNPEMSVAAVKVIFSDAFTGKAAAGGAFGTVLIWGIRRAIFSNEAGLGSASIAHAAVKTNYPVREGVVAALGPMIDTVIICSATAIVIIMSGFYGAERYENMGPKELLPQTAVLGNWREVLTDIPSPQREMQIEGAAVFQYQAGDRKHNALQIPVNTVSNDGIRFSYFQEAGQMNVKLRQIDGTLIADLGVMPGNNTALEPNINSPVELRAEGFFETKKWNTLVLTGTLGGDKNTLASLPENIILELEPQGRYVSWYVDRFQQVSSREGVGLTIAAFDRFFPGFGSYFVAISIFFFAISTMITWYYYGQNGIRYCLGEKQVQLYKWAYITCAFLGSVTTLGIVLSFSDIMIGILVIPNAIAILMLSPKVAELTKDYFTKLKNGEFQEYQKPKKQATFKIKKKDDIRVIELESK